MAYVLGRCGARLCFAAMTVTLFASQTRGVSATQTHILQSGETLDSLARKYGIRVKDIAEANHITDQANIPLHKKIIIPAAPKPTLVPATLHQSAIVKGDRISVRLGPGETHRRVTMFDNGAHLIITAKRDGWAQVTLPDGKPGWIREDFLTYKGSLAKAKAEAKHIAKAEPKREPKHVKVAKEQAEHEAKTARKEKAKRHAERVAKAERAEKKHKQRLKSERAARAEKVARARKRGKRDEERLTWEARQRSSARRTAHHHGGDADTPPSGGDIVRTAYAYRGTPYVYGGESRGGFDCSGFTSYIYRKKGVSLPHSASAQFNQGREVSKGELKPGDLVFFHTVTKGISHVGMYVGNGKFVHASSRRSGGVRVDSLNSGYYQERFRGARRVK